MLVARGLQVHFAYRDIEAVETPSNPVIDVFTSVLRNLDGDSLFRIALGFWDEPAADQLATETMIARR